MKIIKLGVRSKLLILLIPLISIGFLTSGMISVTSSRNNHIENTYAFMQYKMEQLELYTENQWQNLKASGLDSDHLYAEITRETLESYANAMIKNDWERIIAFNSNDKRVINASRFDSFSQEVDSRPELSGMYGLFNEYIFEDVIFIGLENHMKAPDWSIYMLQEKNIFTKVILRLTFLQTASFITSLIVIIAGLLIYLKYILTPLNRVRDTIKSISTYQDLSKKVKVEFADEIGELASEFNIMLSSLDIAYRKIKKYALEESIARKEIYIREREALDLLGRASDYKDPETGAHIGRVSSYSLILSQSIGHSPELQDLLFYSAPLHDIGKLGIPDLLLLKESPLTKEEFDQLKTHTIIGHNILKNLSSKYLKAGAVIALSHHEKFNGKGYPNGIIGADIPIFGRIVSIADVFDALTSKRPYKNPWSFKDARDFIVKEKGEHFDPDLVDHFIANIDAIRNIYESFSEVDTEQLQV